MDFANVKELFIGGKDVFTIYVGNDLAWKKIHGFKIVAKQANSTIQLTSSGTPDPITLVKSTDGGVTWSAYIVGETITLTNVNDYVLLEAGANGNSSIGKTQNDYYKFVTTGKFNFIAEDMNYLLSQSGQTSGALPSNCYVGLFYNCASIEGDIDLSWLTTSATNAFRGTFRNTGISSVDLSGLQSVEGNMLYTGFQGCSNLTSVDLSKLEIVGNYGLRSAFNSCTSLETISFPELTSITGTDGFYAGLYGCTSLKVVHLPKLSSVTGTNALASCFNGCTALEEVWFDEATAVPAISSDTFTNTNNTFKVVVPDSLYSTWIAATNWSALSSHIVKASEYTLAS